MGKNQSKQEEKSIVIAQNGANQATTLEEKIEKYGTFIAAVLVLLLVIGVYFLYKKINKSLKKFTMKAVSMAMPPTDKAQAMQPTVQYA
ncbi:unnamed protein product [Pieris brassicae]|uniref:Uncharacterized protein n=1 Tax=Pieris brassicae TaxID=7116 RepID=A0A9P0TP86_PIEBR|nr:unnamed protein product [Pieris brassicae]